MAQLPMQDPNVKIYIEEAVEPLKKEIRLMKSRIEKIEGANGYVYDIEKDTWSKPIKVVINDVEFEEVSWDLFIVFGEEDKFPFLKSDFSNEGIHYPHRAYKSIAINGKFYAPIIK
jgi:hypothetical protein